jgi:hypothetical protein
MNMSKKLQEKKKKRRERKAKRTVLERREQMRKRLRHEHKVDVDIKKNKEKLEPYISPEKKKLRVQKQIEANMEILRKLEEDYKNEQDTRKQINDKLESEGHKTLQEKVAAMAKEAEALAREDGTIDLTVAPPRL